MVEAGSGHSQYLGHTLCFTAAAQQGAAVITSNRSPLWSCSPSHPECCLDLKKKKKKPVKRAMIAIQAATHISVVPRDLEQCLNPSA